jgi:hypothetical protein
VVDILSQIDIVANQTIADGLEAEDLPMETVCSNPQSYTQKGNFLMISV